MATYRNTYTGTVVELDNGSPEQVDMARHIDQAFRTYGHTGRWELIDAADPSPAADEPKPADVRAWAKEQGIDVPARGNLSAELVESYKAAHAQEGND